MVIGLPCPRIEQYRKTDSYQYKIESDKNQRNRIELKIAPHCKSIKTVVHGFVLLYSLTSSLSPAIQIALLIINRL